MLAAGAKLRTLTFLNHSYLKRWNNNIIIENCIKSIPVGVLSIWSTIVVQSISVGSCQSISTQASPTEVVDEVLTEVLSAMANSRDSGDKLCATYIDKFCNDRNLPGALRLIQALHDKNIFLVPYAYNRLLRAAGEENDIGLLCRSFKDLLVSCKYVNSSSYLIFAQEFIKENDVDLLRFVREVSELIVPSNPNVMNRIISAFAESGQVDKALLIFYQMNSLKCEPDLVTYNIVLGILGRCGRIDEMLNKFAAMKEASLVPDIVSYNTLITGLRMVGRLESCLVFFEEMRERGIKPDLRTYTAMIDSFGKSGNVEESLRLFNEMKHKGICPSINIYRSLITGLKKMGKLELVLTFSDEMKELLSSHLGPKDFKRDKR